MPRLRFRPKQLPLGEQIVRNQKYENRDGTVPARNPWIPRLWNAHRRIRYSKGLPFRQLKALAKNPHRLFDGKEPWRDPPGAPRSDYIWSSRKRCWVLDPIRFVNRPSQDVIDFMDRVKLLPEEKLKLLKSPSRYFSIPENVPEYMRKQIYFPQFTLTLLRTPHLPSKYASFRVPLWFNKLDMKSYLKQVYNVDVIHIRSYVSPHRAVKQRKPNKYGTGPQYREPRRKKMTVLLVEPFVWPEEIKDLKPWNTDNYWIQQRGRREMSREENPAYTKMHANPRRRLSIAEQAKALVEGKTTWRPTWQSMPAAVRAMQGQGRSSPTSDVTAP